MGVIRRNLAICSNRRQLVVKVMKLVFKEMTK
jgi:hypothetical protein